MPCKWSEMKSAFLFPDVGSSANKIQIDEMDWIGKTQFHQRNEALTAGQKLRTFSQLGKHGHCFFHGASSMISECSGIHLPLVLRLPFEIPIEGMPVSLTSGEPVSRSRLGFATSAKQNYLAAALAIRWSMTAVNLVSESRRCCASIVAHSSVSPLVSSW